MAPYHLDPANKSRDVDEKKHARKLKPCIGMVYVGWVALFDPTDPKANTLTCFNCHLSSLTKPFAHRENRFYPTFSLWNKPGGRPIFLPQFNISLTNISYIVIKRLQWLT